MITERFDVVVVGAGAAGIMAAAYAATAPGKPDTLLVTDGPLGRANTVMAQGGFRCRSRAPSPTRRCWTT